MFFRHIHGISKSASSCRFSPQVNNPFFRRIRKGRKIRPLLHNSSLQFFSYRNYCNKESTPWLDWLDWANIAWPAWARMLLLEYLTISVAISVSRIWLSALVVFSTTLSRLLMVCSSLFWTAPSAERWIDTVWIAALMVSIAFFALVSADQFHFECRFYLLQNLFH